MKRFVLGLLAAVACTTYGFTAEEMKEPTSGSWYENIYKDVHGKVDVGPARMFIENKYSSERGKMTDMTGGRVSATLVYPNGFTIKPSVMAAAGEGHLYSGGIALGWYIPANEHFTIIPNVGYSQSYLKTEDIKLLGGAITSAESSIQSRVESVGVDASLKLNDKWSVSAMVQYAWSQSKSHFHGLSTTIPQDPERSESQGINSGISLEYFINDCWSTSITYGHNDANDSDLNGVEGEGIIVAAGYRF